MWRVSDIYYYSENEPEVGENGEYVGNFWYYDAKNSIVVGKNNNLSGKSGSTI